MSESNASDFSSSEAYDHEVALAVLSHRKQEDSNAEDGRSNLGGALQPQRVTSSPGNCANVTKTNLVRALHDACLSGNRNQIISTIKANKSHLVCIPLPPPNPCDASQAVKDIIREKVILNGVRFLGQGSLFLETLRQLASILCSDKTVEGLSGDTQGNFVVDSILTRCARTTSGFDSYNTALQLFPFPEMLLKPRPGQNPPIDIELFVSNGSVHGAVSSTNMYGFYRFKDIEMMGNRMSGVSSSDSAIANDDTDGSGNPWLSLDTVVVEKIDFRTGRSLRFLRIEMPEPCARDEMSIGSSRSTDY